MATECLLSKSSTVFTGQLPTLSQMNFGFLDGVRGALHLDLTHNGRDPELEAMYLKTNQFHTRQFAYLIERLKAIDEGGQSLLERRLDRYVAH